MLLLRLSLLRMSSKRFQTRFAFRLGSIGRVYMPLEDGDSLEIVETSHTLFEIRGCAERRFTSLVAAVPRAPELSGDIAGRRVLPLATGQAIPIWRRRSRGETRGTGEKQIWLRGRNSPV